MVDANKLVTEHISVWTSAIKKRNSQGRGSSKKTELIGIKKLRKLILELAVRGKLVPQDLSDESVSVLIDRISDEKALLISNKKIRKQNPVSVISDEEKPFEIPVTWTFKRFGEVMFNRDGERKPVSSDERRGIQGQYDYYGASGVIDQVNDFLFDKSLLLIGEDGANLINRSTPIAFLAHGKYWVNNHAHVLDGTTINFLEYIALHINAISLEAYITGTAQPKMNQAKMNSIVIAIPPEAEQSRIVAKVDELMLLCDDLEQQTEESISAHQTLVEVLLATLTNATQTTIDTVDTFQQSWQRIAEHFDVLFTTEHSIEQLKQTILQLAVMGKLVPQNPKDEPASVLLEKLAKEKELLIVDKKIKKQKTLPVITDTEYPFNLPLGWEWSRLPDIGELARGKSKHRPRNDPSLYLNGDIKLIQTGDVARSNGQIETNTAMYNEVGLAQSRLWPKGTMCITIAANIADTGILSFDACFPDSVVGFIPFDEKMCIRYFEYFVRTAKSNLEAYAPATAQKNINLEILGQLLVPLPPINELNAIVSKIDDLMALCEQLKARLSEAQVTQLQLADTIVEQAVN
jgi:type I restriction enzyme S subunit